MPFEYVFVFCMQLAGHIFSPKVNAEKGGGASVQDGEEIRCMLTGIRRGPNGLVNFP